MSPDRTAGGVPGGLVVDVPVDRGEVVEVEGGEVELADLGVGALVGFDRAGTVDLDVAVVAGGRERGGSTGQGDGTHGEAGHGGGEQRAESRNGHASVLQSYGSRIR
ncbi:hypothetical protein GCM10019017_63580 [Streptomyces showdoensis]